MIHSERPKIFDEEAVESAQNFPRLVTLLLEVDAKQKTM